jgi:hypothetical protein
MLQRCNALLLFLLRITQYKTDFHQQRKARWIIDMGDERVGVFAKRGEFLVGINHLFQVDDIESLFAQVLARFRLDDEVDVFADALTRRIGFCNYGLRITDYGLRITDLWVYLSPRTRSLSRDEGSAENLFLFLFPRLKSLAMAPRHQPKAEA